MFIVYAIYAPEFKKIYIGYTADIERRLFEHNHALSGFTARFKPWILVYSEEVSDKPNAMKREKQLKTSVGRKFVWDQINKLII